MTAPIRLLYVEDDEIDQLAFARTVKKANLPYLYAMANSLHQAEEALDHQDFDLVICDFRLTDGTALDLIQRYPAASVIVITGAGDETTAVQTMKAGAKDYLIKDAEGDYLKVLPKAVENTLRHRDLERAEREQRLLADTLHETAIILNSTLELDAILRLILENIQRIIPHDCSNIMLIDADVAYIVQHLGCPDTVGEALKTVRFSIRDIPHLHLMYQTHHSFIIDDVNAVGHWQNVIPGYEVRSYLAAPIVVGDEAIGFLNLDSTQVERFTPDDASRLQTFVNHAAVAIKNAQLYKYARDLAAIEERQRLARDLHDSVTQTLFAASVTSNAIIRQWHQDSTSIGDDLIYLRDLTQGALAEMRTLLLELRPTTLVESHLSDLLRQLSETLKGRASLQVHFNADGHGTLPPDVQIAFFRIAQEALNNVIKHARAKHLYIDLVRGANGVTLQIRDDGIGFDPAEVASLHFGIEIMKERARVAGIQLLFRTQPGEGTIIEACWMSEDVL